MAQITIPPSQEELSKLIRLFAIEATPGEIIPFGSGHIHSTYLVKTDGKDGQAYILQQFNTEVFRDPDAVMENTRRVTNHMRDILERTSASQPERRVIRLIPLTDGSDYHRDRDGKVWRVLLYIPDHKSYDRAENTAIVYEGGKAYGAFLAALSSLPPGEFRETIPDFHNLDWRLKQFEQARSGGLRERLEIAAVEIEMLMTRAPEMLSIRKLCLKGDIPLRLVHHDTKINNVLFDFDGKGLCVIDLDTVMPGYVTDDFGDAIRTFTNTGEEDDAKLDGVGMNLAFFEAFARGYLECAGSILLPVEKEYLALSARVMTYMQTVRFLADYLQGDTYYKIHHPEHNLQRTRAQMALLLNMEQQYGEMCRIIKSLS